MPACRTEAERQGHADRITHLSGDLESVAAQVLPADIVTLDRSMCCWADMRVFTHRRPAVEAILSNHGLQRHSYAEVGVWQVAVFSREPGDR